MERLSRLFLLASTTTSKSYAATNEAPAKASHAPKEDTKGFNYSTTRPGYVQRIIGEFADSSVDLQVLDGGEGREMHQSDGTKDADARRGEEVNASARQDLQHELARLDEEEGDDSEEESDDDPTDDIWDFDDPDAFEGELPAEFEEALAVYQPAYIGRNIDFLRTGLNRRPELQSMIDAIDDPAMKATEGWLSVPFGIDPIDFVMNGFRQDKLVPRSQVFAAQAPLTVYAAEVTIPPMITFTPTRTRIGAAFPMARVSRRPGAPSDHLLIWRFKCQSKLHALTGIEKQLKDLGLNTQDLLYRGVSKEQAANNLQRFIPMQTTSGIHELGIGFYCTKDVGTAYDYARAATTRGAILVFKDVDLHPERTAVWHVEGEDWLNLIKGNANLGSAVKPPAPYHDADVMIGAISKRPLEGKKKRSKDKGEGTEKDSAGTGGMELPVESEFVQYVFTSYKGSSSFNA
ncbi:hypothetical protein BJ508DRAFT_371468 [Ascobolus immersus RN42]|uniref:PARP catalytic domain-containing protein n=1 Tax=Ascobolus immersus RN42 TaxID=1160509 RepID=A0A3N4ITC5_ASCIM|nr:hypothetical protein BJ508DRAFT_371468 [Ascobolus immersus RN42]